MQLGKRPRNRRLKRLGSYTQDVRTSQAKFQTQTQSCYSEEKFDMNCNILMCITGDGMYEKRDFFQVLSILKKITSKPH